MASLDGLAPDVLFLMLVNSVSMKILWDFIRASPRMYADFRDQREVVFPIVIAREIGRGTLCEARSALRSLDFEPRGLSKSQARAWLEKYKAEIFLRQNMAGSALGSDAVQLWRQHRERKFIAELYIREALHIVTCPSEPNITGTFNSNTEYNPDDISSTERTLLYRSISDT
jgi:hypothetical protein